MRYWSMSTLAQSPLMAPCFMAELMDALRTGREISNAAFIAYGDVAAHTVPVDAPNLVIVHGEDAPPRRVYLRYPELNEWFRLERGGLTAEDATDGTLWHVMVDALH